jgi:hypothetical protein
MSTKPAAMTLTRLGANSTARLGDQDGPRGAGRGNEPGRVPSADSYIMDMGLCCSAYVDGHRPGRRVVTSWTNQPLPSGSLNDTNEP